MEDKEHRSPCAQLLQAPSSTSAAAAASVVPSAMAARGPVSGATYWRLGEAEAQAEVRSSSTGRRAIVGTGWSGGGRPFILGWPVATSWI